MKEIIITLIVITAIIGIPTLILVAVFELCNKNNKNINTPFLDYCESITSEEESIILLRNIAQNQKKIKTNTNIIIVILLIPIIFSVFIFITKATVIITVLQAIEQF